MINTSSVQIIWRLQTELTIGQTGNDFIISEQRSIMHCKFTNALYKKCLIANI
jgi:hypothetical protein